MVHISRSIQMAPRVGFEPTTLRLTAECSTAELTRNKIRQLPILPSRCQLSTFGVIELNFCVRNGNRWTSMLSSPQWIYNGFLRLHTFFIQSKIDNCISKQFLYSARTFSFRFKTLFSISLRISPRPISIS